MTTHTLSGGWRDVYRTLGCPTSIEYVRTYERGDAL